MDDDINIYDGCVELTPAASAGIGAASGIMAGTIIEIGSGGVATPFAAAAGAAVGAGMQDRMENGGWEATCSAAQSAVDAVDSWFDAPTAPAAPFDPGPALESPAPSFDLAQSSYDSGPSFGSGGGGDFGGGSSGGDGGASSGGSDS